jgi:hypothetical protein
MFETGKFKSGGQGRNRTADASLFRDVRSTAYRQSSMKTQDLRDNDLDSIWTPRHFKAGLDSTLDSTHDAPTALLWHRTCSHARGRPTITMSSRECGDNIESPIHAATIPIAMALRRCASPGDADHVPRSGLNDNRSRIKMTRYLSSQALAKSRFRLSSSECRDRSS